MIKLAFTMAAASLAAPTMASADPRDAPEPRTAAANIAVDEAWGHAQISGDDAFVERLLMPGYQSIGATGRATDKAAIVASARRNASDPTAATARSAEWRASHPLRGEVAIYGDSAVLTWMSAKPGMEVLVSSCDVFVHRDGHWHAIYSQHSQLA